MWWRAVGFACPRAFRSLRRWEFVGSQRLARLRDPQRGSYCWGQNFAGQLGNGEMAGKDASEVEVVSGRSCIRRKSGSVACWGANDRGQIGDATRLNWVFPVTVHGIDDAAQIAMDNGTTCVLRALAGSVVCWGEAPDPTIEHGFAVPKAIAGLHDVVEIRNGSLGSYCARDRSDHVSCWTLSTTAWTQPMAVPALDGAKALGMPYLDTVCAIAADDHVECHNLDLDVTDDLPDFTGADGGGTTGRVRDGRCIGLALLERTATLAQHSDTSAHRPDRDHGRDSGFVRLCIVRRPQRRLYECVGAHHANPGWTAATHECGRPATLILKI
jgi:hypothetical protein